MKPLKIRPDSGIDLSIKNLAFILSVAIAATIGWFQLENRIGDLETANKLMQADLLKKAEQTPKNLEIFMLIEHNSKILEKHQIVLDNNVHTKVLLTVAEKKILKLEEDVEDLKNKFRKVNGNQ